MKKKNLLMTIAAIFGLATITMAQVPNYVPTTGLVAYYPFNGNANDESGNGNNGTVNGATLTTDRFGDVNSSYNFSNNLITIPYNSQLGFNTNSSFSIGIWAFKDGAQNVMHLAGKRSLGDPYFNWQIVYGNNFVNFQSGTGPGNTLGVVSNSIFLNQSWTYFVGVYNNSEWELYVDGVLNSTASGLATLDDLSDLTIGNSGGFQPFYGKLDDIGIWNRALTACEISDLYNSQLNSSASIQAGTDVSICEGNDVIFNGSGGSNYTWNNGVQNGVAYTPTISQEYIVIGQDANNCYGTDTIYVELIPNTTATQTETALDSYTWPINSQTYTQSGTYTAVIPNAAGCDSTITLDLSLDFTGIEVNSQGALFSVFPNPAQSLINIKVDSKLIGSVYTIYDNTGRAVLSGKLNSENKTIELNNLSGGIYMFSVGENMKQTFKVIKE